MSDRSVARFFDSLSNQYTEAIERCFPRYREMLWALLEYLPRTASHDSILELGAGTGNLTVLLADTWSTANLHVVDLSGESLEVCRSRLPERDTLEFQVADFRELDFPAERFDAIVSSIAIHHLNATEKRRLFEHAFHWLRPGGVFAFVDQFRGTDASVTELHLKNWQSISQAAGSNEEEWTMWMQHRDEHDHHDTLPDQLRWLEAAGFETVDCTWRYLMWAMLTGRKPRR